jgi:Ca2+-binding RTX toxin-like protein
MKRKHLLILLAVAAATFAFGASDALAATLTFDPVSGELGYYTNDAVDPVHDNEITVHPAESVGFSSWTVIDYRYYIEGQPFTDQNIGKYCFQEGAYFACPAKKVWIRTFKGDDKIKVSSAIKFPTRLEGGAGNDVISGGGGPDQIWGACGSTADPCYGYSDTLYGNDGDDKLHGGNMTPVFGIPQNTLFGGMGNDMLDGGTGHDQLWGGPGIDLADYSSRQVGIVAWLDDKANDGTYGENDYIHADVEGVQGGSAGDTFYGNAGANWLKGGGGDDALYGMAGPDQLYGEDGNDSLDGGADTDNLYGGANSIGVGDTANYWDRWNPLVLSLDGVANDGEAGENDFIAGDVENLAGGTGNDHLYGNGQGNKLWGANGNDVIDGKGGGYVSGAFVADKLDGGNGNDLLGGGPAGGVAPDTIEGGAGTDVVTYAARNEAVTIMLDAPAGNGEDVVSNVENAWGSGGADTIVGNDGPNVLYGLGGNDTIAGNGGDDSLYGGDSIDTMDGGAGHDLVSGDYGNDTLMGGAGPDDLNGGGNSDTVSYAGIVAAVSVSLDGVKNDGASGEGDNVSADVENVVGGSGGDTITGNAAANVLNGGPGADTIHGGDGPDQVYGGSENDKLYGDAGYDNLRGGTGADLFDGGSEGDTADYSASASAVQVNLATKAASGEGADTFNAVENVFGSPFNDTLTGDGNVNNLSGFEGNDTILGGGQNDQLGGGLGDDVLRGEAGDDQIDGGAGVDTVSYAGAPAAVVVNLSAYPATATGGAGNDALSFLENVTGSGYNDTITGTTGPNVLKGSGGNDTLNGMGGDDLLDGETGVDTLDGGLNVDTCLGETKANCEK